MAELNGRDVFATRKLMDVMIPDAEEMKCLDQYRTSMLLIPILIDAQAAGIKIDEKLRKTRIKKISSRQASLEQQSKDSALSWIEEAGLDGFRWIKQCPCCNGGKMARSMCWRCAGFKKKPTKKAWSEWIDRQPVSDRHRETLHRQLKEMKAPEVGPEWLSPCETCGGVGETFGYDFNPMSPKQMVDLLYGELRVPKFTYFGDVPNASEETMKKILEWASE